MTIKHIPRGVVAAIVASAIAVIAVTVIAIGSADAQSADSGPTRSGEALSWTTAGPVNMKVTTPSDQACGGEPCIELTDTNTPARAAGDCTSLSDQHLALRCKTSGMSQLTLTSSGDQPVGMTVAPASAGCSELQVNLEQKVSSGAVEADDGCKQRVVCTFAHTGAVSVDAIDEVSGCSKVTTDGTQTTTPGLQPECQGRPGQGCVPNGGGGGQDVQTKPTQAPVPGQVPPSGPGNSGASAGRAAPVAIPKPVTKVTLRRGVGRRYIRAAVRLKQSTRFDVTLYRRTARGRYIRVGSRAKSGRSGRNVLALRAKRGKLKPGTYKAKVATAVPYSRLVSSSPLKVR